MIHCGSARLTPETGGRGEGVGIGDSRGGAKPTVTTTVDNTYFSRIFKQFYFLPYIKTIIKFSVGCHSLKLSHFYTAR